MTATETLDLQRAAKEHLWMHFTRMGGYEAADVPIIVRGEGCYLEDANGKRYLDALAGLFSVNVVASAIFLVAIAIALGNVLWQYRSAKTEQEAP